MKGTENKEDKIKDYLFNSTSLKDLEQIGAWIEHIETNGLPISYEGIGVNVLVQMGSFNGEYPRAASLVIQGASMAEM